MSNDSTQPMNKEKIAQAASRKAAFETQTFKPENKENKKNKLADIVVGLDGSDESFAALRWAMEEARHTGQRVNAVFGWTLLINHFVDPIVVKEGFRLIRAYRNRQGRAADCRGTKNALPRGKMVFRLSVGKSCQ